ncbi:F-box protein: endocytic membrane traffic, recycling ReCYcling 1 [Monascus purpureus]|uniref:F-box protein: endocytic membrane traffic, recycling ReCYcling 1 n=1 Tax=Monascus purpureus TaxID=5098 RepID=A0A507R210_MONPU|nr:F-box protein: endocytic membrane traffic, recycling ReCYcling 1 [Monascus purpureus]
MSTVKTKPRNGKPPRNDVLASLHMASLEEVSRAALPAEIVASILDYVSAVDLIRAARSSKLLREMAYDDTRWVQRLKRMGCWNESDARKHVERLHGTIVNVESVERQDLAEEHSAPVVEAQRNSASDLKSLEDGFDKIDLSTITEKPDIEADGALVAMKEARSIRGEARQEYGKIHAALAPFYDDIVNSGATSESLVFKKYKDPEHQAVMLSQLQSFAKCDTTQGWRERVARLELAVQMFETSTIRNFQQGYEEEDIDGAMRKYSHVLSNLNGAVGAVEWFINNNHLVTRKSDYGRVSDCIDPLTGRVRLEHTQAFFTRLSVALNEEISVINKAFPPSANLAGPFLEKVGQDVLYPFLTAIFDELHRTDMESYLIAVSGTFVQCRRLSQTMLPIQHCGNEFHSLWWSVIAKVYETHIDLYLAEELDYFRKLSESAVTEWDRQLSEQAASTESFLMSNINRQADKRDFLTSFKKVIMMPVNILPSFSSSSKSNESKPDQNPACSRPSRSPNRFSTITPSPSPIPLTEEPPTTELAAKAAIMKMNLEGIRSLFSIEVALNLVHNAKSSLERAAQFVKMEQDTGLRHVIGGFNKAVGHLSNYRPREQGEREQSGVEPLITFLELVNVGDLILQMMDVFYEQELVGTKLTDRNDFLDPAVKEKKKFEQMLDECVAAGLNKGIDVLMEEVDYILATRQLATDFNPGLSTDPHRSTMEVGVTEAATAVVDVVSSHTQMLVGSTDKSTLDVFNQEVGLRLFAALCKHLKRQRISVEGSLRLISDMNHYFKFIQGLKNNDLLLYFRGLRELAQIYLIDPSDAKALASIIADPDRFSGIWGAQEVYEFAERRADWYQVKRDVERAMYGFGCTVM